MTSREDVFDGFHTFQELYEYRLAYNALLFNEWGKTSKYRVHKSWRHSNGELCFGGGWFIVVAQTPFGQISNHYEEKYWQLFDIPARNKPEKFDGHTPAVALERMAKLLQSQVGLCEQQ